MIIGSEITIIIPPIKNAKMNERVGNNAIRRTALKNCFII
jgi:hypothetical protein